jgi:hypothetical protein
LRSVGACAEQEPVGDAPQRRVLGRLQGRFSLPDEKAPPIPETPEEFIDAVEGR